MLTIPNSIKTLFKTDGTRKNFRVQFPNNELPDITNDNIVRESVHFTESICSQSTFRFGLAEASVIEFETVGIGNMYGMTIECSYEIDTSSLSASELSDIQSDPGDGELVLASASDIGYGFYRVPLGVFRVEKCPRNHGAMTHRQVTAYQYPNPAALPLSPPQKSIFELSVFPYSADLASFVFGNLGYYNESSIDAFFTRSALYSTSDMVQRSYTVPLRPSAQNYGVTIVRSGLTVLNYDPTATSVIGYDAPKMDYSAIDAYINSVATAYSLTASIIENTRRYVGVQLVDATGYAPYWSIHESSVYSFYPWTGQSVAGGARNPTLFFPTNITIRVEQLQSGSWITVEEQTFTATSSEATVFSFSQTATLPQATVVISSSDDEEMFTKTVTGMAETSGEFGKANRAGGIEVFALSPSSPLAISPGDYDECWWDEYDVSPIGTVTVTYRNGEEGEATANVTLGAGASLYDMTDNEVLKNLSTADLDSITTLLSGDFATNAQNVGFTPIEMTMQGFPWLEAGDALQITAEDGTVVNTYALRVEMSGIQHLMSDITAEGGEIIGEV